MTLFVLMEIRKDIGRVEYGNAVKVSMSQKAKAYRDQAAYLLELAGREGSTPTPYAGGITISDKEVDWDNTNLVRAGFFKGQFDDDRDGNNQNDLRPLWAGADT